MQPSTEGLWQVGINGQAAYQEAYSRDLRCLLGARAQRPCHSAAEQRDELAASDHSMTSSARSRNDSGIVRPSACAVVRLMTRSNFVGCSTGRSAGFAPRRILSTYSAARRNRSEKFTP